MNPQYDFTITQEDTINFLKEHLKNINAEKLYLVRNIFARYAVYAKSDDASIIDRIKQLIDDSPVAVWIDSIEQIDNAFLLKELDKNSVTVTENFYFSERSIEKTNWFPQQQKPDFKKIIVSFYSFKGGLGRSTAMVLTAIELARRGKKIVLIDFDLEAPGLLSFFSDSPAYNPAVKGVVDFIVEYQANKSDITKLDISDYMISVTEQALIGTKGGELILIPAAATNAPASEEYLIKLAKIDLRINEYKKYIPDLLFEAIINRLKPDFIFIDSRTGINDIGGMILNRYSTMAFLFFFGNQQNMFGLEAIMPFLPAPEKDYSFFIVNSPVPEQETDRDEEIEFFLEHSYNIFCNHYYSKNAVPDIRDETAPHSPILVPFSRTAVNLNRGSKLTQLLSEGGEENPYKKIADIIGTGNPEQNYSTEDKKGSESEIVKLLSRISPVEIAASENEFKTEADLKARFYPRRDYKYIFDPDKFLILGSKGTGKTALFSALNHFEYTKNLAAYCGADLKTIENSFWCPGYDDSKDFPSKTNFNSLKDFNETQFYNYWLILLFRSLPLTKLEILRFVEPEMVFQKFFSSIKNWGLADLKEHAEHNELAEKLEDILLSVDAMLDAHNRTIFVVYDYLDLNLSPENNLRGRCIGALVSLWYNYAARLKRIKAKVFLRNDIFEREVITGTDKVKVKNYTVDIKWDYDQLINVIWKRLLALGNDSRDVRNLFKEFEAEINDQYEGSLGRIPDLKEESNRKILNKLLGTYMGSNNKAFPYNWIKYHTSDANLNTFPRSMIILFSSTAQKQLNDPAKIKTIIRPYNMETSMQAVSEARVTDLKEEYPELLDIFGKLHEYVKQFPVEKRKLTDGLKKLSREQPAELIEKLIKAGVLYEYKRMPTTGSKRYHIPDIYLIGMKLQRRGPGAHKALFGRH